MVEDPCAYAVEPIGGDDVDLVWHNGGALLGYFFVLNTSRYGTADCPPESLKLPYFALFTQMA